MIVYSSTKQGFSEDVVANLIADKILKNFRDKLRRKTSPREIEAWKNSMLYMNNILLDEKIPKDAGVSIEYKIPQTSNRIDFIVTGKNDNREDTAIIIELKQWSDVEKTNKDAIVKTFIGGAIREVSHPSYQAWSYVALLNDYNETVQKENIRLRPCAYLHNCKSHEVVNHSFYQEYTKIAPSFLRNDAQRLQAFIKQHVRYGDADGIMYRIDNGKIKPSKNLVETLISLLEGNPEFIMIDEQKVVYETSLELTGQSSTDNKTVLIVEGGPGTGKSVVAINLLVELTKREYVAQYVTKNAAPREVYRTKLTGSFKKGRINNLFRSSSGYFRVDKNSLDALVVDEAHRLVERGIYDPAGGNQIKEIIDAAKHVVFFVDEDQLVTWKDIGDKQAIRHWANLAKASVQELELASQFRCNGSDGYLAWLDNVLQLRETANETLEGLDYEFKVLESPDDLRDEIFSKNRENGKARLVAGYCWDWISPKDPSRFDIEIPGTKFSMKWNLKDDGSLWIMKPETINEVGCIHTCQGLELDYVGVIIGPDFVVRDGIVQTDAAERSKHDSSVKGYKKLLREDPEKARERADKIIKNTYKVLMTRGQKGCYIYCTDPETREYFCSMLGETPEKEEISIQAGTPFKVMEKSEVIPFENSVPLIDFEIAAGGFGDEQFVNDIFSKQDGEIIRQFEWVKLDESFRIRPGMFIAKVVGESMNKRVPNGTWCLFKLAEGGSRNGKVVIVQHRDIQDPDTGGHFTIKTYSSEKEFDDTGQWEHQKIILSPDSTDPSYTPIVLEKKQAGELRVLGELVAVLG